MPSDCSLLKLFRLINYADSSYNRIVTDCYLHYFIKLIKYSSILKNLYIIHLNQFRN